MTDDSSEVTTIELANVTERVLIGLLSCNDPLTPLQYMDESFYGTFYKAEEDGVGSLMERDESGPFTMQFGRNVESPNYVGAIFLCDPETTEVIRTLWRSDW